METRFDPSGNTLPEYVHFKHGAYYLVRNHCWQKLCRKYEDLPGALSVAGYDANKAAMLPSEDGWLLRYMRKVYSVSRNNARGRRDIEFKLTFGEAMALLTESNFRCAVTGMAFSPLKIKGTLPYAPSIDRIDSDGSYIKNNCRVVCVAANYAMNVWGDTVLQAMLDSRKRSRIRPSNKSTRAEDWRQGFFE